MAQNVVDEFGRVIGEEITSVEPGPLYVFSKDRERWRGYTGKLSIESAAYALLAAERGDMSAQMTLFQQMEERDAALGSAMLTRKAAPLGLERHVEPAKIRKKPELLAKQSEQEKKHDSEGPSDADEHLAAEIQFECEEMLDGIQSLDDSLFDVADSFGKGISCSEIDYTEDLRIERLRHIPSTLYQFDEDNRFFIDLSELEANKKIYPADYPGKFLIFHSKLRTGHPKRAGSLRPVVFPYIFRSYAQKDWSVFCEIFGMPIRVGKYGPGAQKDDKRQLADMLRQLGSDSWAIISDKTSIEFEEAINRGSEPYSAFFTALRTEYYLAILGQEQTNVHNPAGGRTQVAEGGSRVRQDLLEADCKQLQSAIREQLLHVYVMLHHGKEIADRFTPTLKFHYEPPKDLNQEALRDKVVLIDMKLGESVTKKSVADKYGWEMAPDDTPEEEMLLPRSLTPEEQQEAQSERIQALARLGGGGAPPDNVAQFRQRLAEKFAEAGSATPEQRALDLFVESQLEKADAAMRSIPAPIQAIIAEANDLHDLQERLRKAYTELDATKFARLLARSLMVARLFGRATIPDQAE
jgi:phage gp29-like protein